MLPGVTLIVTLLRFSNPGGHTLAAGPDAQFGIDAADRGVEGQAARNKQSGTNMVSVLFIVFSLQICS
jgi:hypothetical protein